MTSLFDVENVLLELRSLKVLERITKITTQTFKRTQQLHLLT